MSRYLPLLEAVSSEDKTSELIEAGDVSLTLTSKFATVIDYLVVTTFTFPSDNEIKTLKEWEVLDPSHSFKLRVNLPVYTSLENHAVYD